MDYRNLQKTNRHVRPGINHFPGGSGNIAAEMNNSGRNMARFLAMISEWKWSKWDNIPDSAKTTRNDALPDILIVMTPRIHL